MDDTESFKNNARAALSSLYHHGRPGNELFGLSLFSKWWEAKELSYWYICQGAKARPNLREAPILYKDCDTVAKAMASVSVPAEGEATLFPFIVHEGDPHIHLKERKFLKDVFTLQHYLLHPKSEIQVIRRYADDKAIQVRWKGIPDEPDVFMHVTLEDLLMQANIKFEAPDQSQYSKRKQLLAKYVPVINKQLKAFRLEKYGMDLSKQLYDTEIFCCGDTDKLPVLSARAFDRNGDIARDAENFMNAVKKSSLTGMSLLSTGDGGSIYLKID